MAPPHPPWPRQAHPRRGVHLDPASLRDKRASGTDATVTTARARRVLQVVACSGRPSDADRVRARAKAGTYA